MRANRLVEFAQAILESAALPVMFEQCFGTADGRRIVGDEKEVFRHQEQLPAVWIGSIHNYQDQPLGVSPGVGTVRAKLDHPLVTFLGWPARGSLQVGFREGVESGIGLQTPDKMHLFVRHEVHVLAAGETSIQP